MLDPLDSGTVLWQGNPILRETVPRFRAAAIYCHQRTAMLAATVEESLRRPFDLKIHRGKKFDRPWVLDRLARLERQGSFLEQPVANLSGGEMQIAALLPRCNSHRKFFCWTSRRPRSIRRPRPPSRS